MQRIFCLSGNGAGAGKTTAAKKFADQTYSIAGGIRSDLSKKIHDIDWYRTDQEYKDTKLVTEWGRNPDTDRYMSVREVMIRYGQLMTKESPTYWVDKLIDHLKQADRIADMRPSIAVDDVRKVCELDALRIAFPGKVIHVHILGNGATEEKLFENQELHEIADYIMEW